MKKKIVTLILAVAAIPVQAQNYTTLGVAINSPPPPLAIGATATGAGQSRSVTPRTPAAPNKKAPTQ